MPIPSADEGFVRVFLFKIRWKDPTQKEELDVFRLGINAEMDADFKEFPGSIPSTIKELAHNLIRDFGRQWDVSFELFEYEGKGHDASCHRISEKTLERIPAI